MVNCGHLISTLYNHFINLLIWIFSTCSKISFLIQKSIIAVFSFRLKYVTRFSKCVTDYVNVYFVINIDSELKIKICNTHQRCHALSHATTRGKTHWVVNSSVSLFILPSPSPTVLLLFHWNVNRTIWAIIGLQSWKSYFGVTVIIRLMYDNIAFSKNSNESFVQFHK